MEYLSNVMDIINKNFMAAEEFMNKINKIQKAKLSIEYIKNNYLTSLKFYSSNFLNSNNYL